MVTSVEEIAAPMHAVYKSTEVTTFKQTLQTLSQILLPTVTATR